MKKFFSVLKDALFTKKEVKHSEKYYKVINFLNKYSYIFHALLSCVVVFIVELASRRNLMSALRFMGNTPLTYIYNAFLVFASLTLVYLFRRRAFVRLIICAFWSILGVINGIVLSNRVTPFGFADLKMIPDLLAMNTTTYFTSQQATMVVVTLIVFILFCVILYIKGPRFQGRLYRVRTPLIILGVMFIAIPVTTRAAQSTNIVSDYFANIAQGYENYGFVYSFSSGVIDRGMDKPNNYNSDSIQSIIANVNADKEITVTTSENGPNIITVLLESFVDPYDFNFIEYSKDPAPTFHYLKENFSSGYVTVPVIGAGTANTEFEVLTGMKLSYFGTGEYPYKSIMKKLDNCESIAAVLKSLGYGTHAVHNNGGNFYSRREMFAKMGFDTFICKEMMNITEFTPNESWAEDSILAEETIKTLLSTPNQPDFTYTITVGMHGGYPEESVIENPYCEVYGLETEALTNQWTYYMHQLNKTDQFIAELISMVSELGEDTIIVFWGDHLPTMGLGETDMVNENIYQTSYVTWNNFGLEKEDADYYAYTLMPEILGTIGIHEGTLVTYHQTQSDNEDQTAYLNGVELLQYDILYGKRYCYNGDYNKYPAADLVMGVDEVIISDITLSEDGKRYVITGEGFTKWSKVYVNGDKIGTTYISGNQLSIKVDKVDEGDTIVVQQMGSSNTVFRVSNQWIFTTPTVTETELTTETETTTDTQSETPIQ